MNWQTIGIWTAFAFLGTLGAYLLLPHFRRTFAVLTEKSRKTPFRAILTAIAVGLLVAYGGSKPEPGPTPGPRDEYTLTILPTGDTNGCKVVGSGNYSEGQIAKLKVTPAAAKKKLAQEKTVFVGWYYSESDVCLSFATNLKYPMPSEDVELEARFVTAAADKTNIVACVNGMMLEPWISKTKTQATETNVMAGVYLEWPVVSAALTPTTVKVSGLPSGLKFTAKPVTKKVGSGKSATVVTNIPANTIYGVPAASKVNRGTGDLIPSKVKIAVTTMGKSTQTYQIDLSVEALPTWAYGTFNGFATTNDVVGAASMTVGANGKISGKYALCGTNWTFSASGYTEFLDDELETNRLFAVDTIAKSGKLSRDLRIEISPGWITNTLAYRFPDAWIMTEEDAAAYVQAHEKMVWPYNPPLIPYTQEVSRVSCSRADGFDAAGTELVLHRNIWKATTGGALTLSVFGTTAPYLTPCKNLVVDPEKYPDVKATVSASGTVKFSGKLPNGEKISSTTTAYLVPGSEKPRALLLAPTSKTSDGWLDEVLCPYEEYFFVPISRWEMGEQ